MKIKEYKSLFKESIELPKVGDIILTGKFKNKVVEITGFDVDGNNQPVVLTTKGKVALFHFRIKKLMDKK